MEIGTWLAVAILGLGSLAIFAWFLSDLKGIMRKGRPGPGWRRGKGGARWGR